jgi:hypothetical protein
LLGQLHARLLGLGDLLPPDHLRSAARAIFTHNFRRDFRDHVNCQRTYVLNDEAGLLLCTWPHGGRPRFPFVYSDEVWTGIEYAVAAELIYEGWLDEGLEIVQALRARHDGLRRNPWDEVECGHHYARSMASWALLPALSGFQCDVAAGRLTFAPALTADEFRCFFSAGTAWGTFAQQDDARAVQADLTVEGGSLDLRHLTLVAAGARAVRADLNGAQVALRLEPADNRARLVFDPPLVLGAGDTLRVRLERT